MPRRPGRGTAALCTGAVLLSGCSGGGPAGRRPPDVPSAAPVPVPASPASPTGVAGPPVDPARAPRTPGRARALVAEVIAGPADFGPAARPGLPYESDPGQRPVLDGECDWRQRPLPREVLATRTRSFRIPAGPGREAARLTATVTVYRSSDDAAWELARAMEDLMRCPAQRLREDQWVGALFPAALYAGEQDDSATRDAFSETGEFHDQSGGPYPYGWSAARYGPVTVAVGVRGGPGTGRESIAPLVASGRARMLLRAGQRIGRWA
ncbi:hypothetical protein [Streptomyces sp. NPDC089919]|uniref:hypothetical protein n=1 Tax=Streptomyces sp. NPDC089919 TaxID=3155188 RepID=UPI003431A372